MGKKKVGGGGGFVDMSVKTYVHLSCLVVQCTFEYSVKCSLQWNSFYDTNCNECKQLKNSQG